MKLVHDADLSACNTLRVPARARALAEIEHWYDLEKVLGDPELTRLPCLVLGDGSNILFRDDYPGLIVRIANRGIHLLEQTADEVYLRVAAGENWHGLVQWAVARNYWGIENLSLIPGTVGAAPVQNIGAYGVELDESLVSVRAYDRIGRQWRDFSRAECGFSYRSSLFKEDLEARYCITELVLKLQLRGQARLEYPGLREAVESLDTAAPGPAEISEAVCSIRRSKLPDPAKVANAGSFFKNPVINPGRAEEITQEHPEMPVYPVDGGVKLSAAWMIDQCGFKGITRGGAGVYERHALVLVNRGGATGRELWALAREIEDAVFERFGIPLEPEPLIV